MRVFMRMVLLISVCACAIQVAASPALGQGNELPTLAVAMSEHGQIALFSSDCHEPISPFLWERGAFIDLDPERAWNWFEFRLGLDVNNHGQVVGSAFPGSNLTTIRPLLLERGRITDLMGSSPGSGWAVAINNRGQVVGVFSEDPRFPPSNAFLWDGGEWTDLGPCSSTPDAFTPSFAYGLDINDRGEVAGISGGGSFFWKDGVRTPLDFVVTGINNRGQVIGNAQYYPYVSEAAYLWEDGTRIDLGTLGGTWTVASAINDKGQVAGMSQTATGEYHAFLWEDGHMTDLGGTNAHIEVQGINDKGQVVAFQGVYPGGVQRGWLFDRGAETLLFELLGFPLAGRVMIDHGGRVAVNVATGCSHSYLWSDGELVLLSPPAAPVMESTEPLAGRGAPASPTIATNEPGVMEGPAGFVTLAMASENPFGRSATLRYTVPRPARVTIDVLDLRGARIRSLADEWQSAGSRLATWDGADAAGRPVSPGLYFARLRVGGESRSAKLIRGGQ